MTCVYIHYTANSFFNRSNKYLFNTHTNR